MNITDWSVAAVVIVVVCACLIEIHSFVRRKRIATFRQRTKQVLEPDPEATRSLVSEIAKLTQERITQMELGAYGSVTAAEYVWSWAAIDPAVVKAADFSSKATIDSGYD